MRNHAVTVVVLAAALLICSGTCVVMQDAVAAGPEPNLFELRGGGIKVTYSTSSFDGQPQLTYEDQKVSLIFQGEGDSFPGYGNRSAAYRYPGAGSRPPDGDADPDPAHDQPSGERRSFPDPGNRHDSQDQHRWARSGEGSASALPGETSQGHSPRCRFLRLLK